MDSTHSSVGSPRLIALIVACAMFMAQLDGSIVVLALPDMARAFGSSAIQLSSGITAYLMAQVILLPISGWVADRLGARAVFAGSIAVFTIASVLCALSGSLSQFIAARVLQGAAAALMAPVGRLVMLQSTPKQDLVRVMTISSMSMLLAPTLGPALGGFITMYWSWKWIFLLNVPIGIIGIPLALRFIGPIARPPRRPFDGWGFVLFAATFTPVLYAAERLSIDSLDWTLPALLLGLGGAAGVAAVRHARRTAHPILSLSSIHIPTYKISTLTGGAAVRVPVRAMAFVLPLMFQLSMGFDPLQSGLLLLALNGGDLVLKTIATRTLARFGFRTALGYSALLLAISIMVCATFSRATPLPLLCLALIVSGMCRSLLFTGISTLAFADVPRDQLSSSSVLWNVVQQATNSLAVSLSAIILTSSAWAAGEQSGRLSLHDFHVALWIMAIISLVSLPSFLGLRHDAGSEVSGHQPSRPRPAAPG